MPAQTPRGIWYESARDRYRVRLYRNKIPYLIGYYDTLDEAKDALDGLRGKLKGIPKRRHNVAARVPCSTFRGVAQVVHEERALDPRPYTRH